MLLLQFVLYFRTLDVLAWIGSFIIEKLEQMVKTRCDASAEHRTDPVYPVRTFKRPSSYSRAKTAGWVE